MTVLNVSRESMAALGYSPATRVFESGDYEYLTPELISRYDLYFSFTGGPVLKKLEQQYGSPVALPLYCSVDLELYYSEHPETLYDLGYLGTYSTDRQPPLKRMMQDAAQQWSDGKFIVAGPQYPESVSWPRNVQRVEHLPPAEHRQFYNSQRFTLNITRQDMIRTGYAPSVRLFEAAACGTPIISDWWKGLDSFFIPEKEILISTSANKTQDYLQNLSDEERLVISDAAKAAVLAKHTSDSRAEQLENFYQQAMTKRKTSRSPLPSAG